MTNNDEDNDIELGDEDERPFPDSDEAIRALQDVAEGVDELEAECYRLRAELKTALAERDAARQAYVRIADALTSYQKENQMTTNNQPSDTTILEAVADAFKAEGNWVDNLPDYISDSGNTDPHYVGTLDDGRDVMHTPWLMDKYSIQ